MTPTQSDSPSAIAFIGGSGFYELPELCAESLPPQKTPYGVVNQLKSGRLHGASIYFLSRHGSTHRLPPHAVNYRANIWALNQLGVTKIIAFNAVGGLYQGPGTFILPDQIIDYTYGRNHTFADEFTQAIVHVDFTEPFCPSLRALLISVFGEAKIALTTDGVYACTQGPRLETAAEIERLGRDGCHLVGMTLMPEAALARELGMDYAALCTVVNWAAGKSADIITVEAIAQVLQANTSTLKALTHTIAEALITSR